MGVLIRRGRSGPRAWCSVIVTASLLGAVVVGAASPSRAATSPPGRVDTVGAVPGDGAATVTWSLPQTGGAPAAYVATATPGQVTCTSDGPLTCQLTGLENGVAYQVHVTASNDGGEGPASPPSAPVRPRPAEFPPAGFDDVPAGAYFTDAVDWMALFAISRGTSPGLFEPDLSITRAQMAAFLWRTMDTPSGNPPHGFSDVPTGAYYEEAVAWLRVTGITTGKADGRYGPSDSVTRAQMAAFMWRMAGSPEGAPAHGFSDVPSGAYYDQAVRWLREHAITTGGASGGFEPEAPVTRAQMAAFLHRLALAGAAWGSRVATPSTVLFTYNTLRSGLTLSRVDHLVTGVQVQADGTTTLTMPADAAPQTDEIVNAGPTSLLPSGILGRVTGVSTSGSTATVTVARVALTEVVSEGRFHLSSAGVSDDVYKASGGYRSFQQASVFAAHSEQIPCGPGADVSLSVDPWVDRELSLGAAWTGSGGAEASFEGSAEIGAEVELVVGAGSACEWGKTIPGPKFGVVVVPIGPLLVPFTLDVVAELNLTVAAEAAMSVTGRASAGLEVYAWYLDGESGGSLSPVRSSELAASLDGKVSARFDIAGKLRFRALGVGGPEIGVGPFLEATASSTESPCLTVDAGIQASLDVALEVWKVQASWSVIGGDLQRWNLISRTSPCPTGGDAVAIDGGANAAHVCALRSGGTVACWGENGAGQLGDGTRTNRSVPVTGGITDATAVSVGDQHTCALNRSGEVWCWGANGDGQLGNGASGQYYELQPQRVLGLTDVVAIEAGGGHTCALRSGGTVACWGANASGQVGDGTRTTRTAPVDVLEGAASLSAGGWGNTCALLQDGGVACWGDNSYGQIGDGTVSDSLEGDRLTPVRVSGIADAISVSTGNTHTCAARASGAVYCWGLDHWGTLGIGQNPPRDQSCDPDCGNRYLTPRRTLGIDDAVDVVVGSSHSCAVRAGRTVTCWGLNWWGQIGNGQLDEEVYEAGQGPALPDLAAVAPGGFGTCALDRGGNVFCWGNNASGSLGTPTTEQFVPNPVRVSGFGG